MERVESGSPGVGSPWLVRPQYLVPAIVALVAAVASLLVSKLAADDLPRGALAVTGAEVAFLPLVVFACRYYELARFAAVRRSGWALVIAVAAIVLLFVAPLFEEVWRLRLPFAFLLFVMTVSLFSRQRHLHAAGVSDSGDAGGELDWPFGGLLAFIGAAALLSALGIVRGDSGPWDWAVGFLAIVILWLQTRSHAWFPGLACTWMFANCVAQLLGPAAKFGWEVQAVIGACALMSCLYLLVASRVRRTFTRRV